jgi:hypothetical protein
VLVAVAAAAAKDSGLVPEKNDVDNGGIPPPPSCVFGRPPGWVVVVEVDVPFVSTAEEKGVDSPVPVPVVLFVFVVGGFKVGDDHVGIVEPDFSESENF